MMRRILMISGLCLLLYGCSSPPSPRKETVSTTETAPDVYRVALDTSKGMVIIEVTRAWSPRGADRFYNLIRGGFYDGNRFFRVVRNFVVQFGINGDPTIERLWANMTFPDDAVKESNKAGTIAFATRGPATRTTQVFFNLRDNTSLDARGFAPFGRVASGMDVVERLYSAYGDGPPRGEGPNQNLIETQGNAYLEDKFPRLDYIRKATISR